MTLHNIYFRILFYKLFVFNSNRYKLKSLSSLTHKQSILEFSKFPPVMASSKALESEIPTYSGIEVYWTAGNKFQVCIALPLKLKHKINAQRRNKNHKRETGKAMWFRRQNNKPVSGHLSFNLYSDSDPLTFEKILHRCEIQLFHLQVRFMNDIYLTSNTSRKW